MDEDTLLQQALAMSMQVSHLGAFLPLCSPAAFSDIHLMSCYTHLWTSTLSPCVASGHSLMLPVMQSEGFDCQDDVCTTDAGGWRDSGA